MSVFPFGYASLLRGVDTRALVHNTFLSKVFSDGSFKVFTYIIRFQHLYLGMKLSLDHRVEFLKYWSYFRFFSHEKYPGNSSMVINEEYKSPSSGDVSNP